MTSLREMMPEARDGRAWLDGLVPRSGSMAKTKERSVMRSSSGFRFFRRFFGRMFFLSAVQAGFASQTLAAPVAKVTVSSHHFGTVREGDRVKHTFQVSNQGDEPLIIARIVPGCGCTAVTNKLSAIAPGESTPIEVSFASEGFSGPFSTTISIYVNDPQRAYLDLKLQGEVRPYLSVLPERVLFADVIQLRGSEIQEVVIRKSPGKAVTARSLSRAVGVDVKSDTREELRLAVRIAPNAPLGELRERISVRESGNRKSFSIPVFAVVKPLLEASRSTIVLSSGGSLVNSEGYVILNYWGDRPFGPPRVVFSQERGIFVRTRELDPGRTWEVSFSIDSQKSAGSVDERVTILGSDDTGPSTSLRIVTSTTSSRR